MARPPLVFRNQTITPPSEPKAVSPSVSVNPVDKRPPLMRNGVPLNTQSRVNVVVNSLEEPKKVPQLFGKDLLLTPESTSWMDLFKTSSQYLSSTAAGALGVLNTIGESALKPIARGVDKLTGKPVNPNEDITGNKETIKKLEEYGGKSFTNDLFESLGSSAPFMFLGVGAGAAAQGISIARKTGAGAIQAMPESFIEAKQTYETIKSDGGSKKKAITNAVGTFLANELVNTGSFLLGFGADSTSKVKDFFKEYIAEIGQEDLQQIVQNVATNKPVFQGLAETTAISAIISSPSGYANIVSKDYQKSPTENPSAFMKQAADKGATIEQVADLVSKTTGTPIAQATEMLQKTVATDPELKQQYNDNSINAQKNEIENIARRIQFLSPNTKENLTKEDVQKNISSPEYQKNYDEAQAMYTGDGVQGELEKGQGDWGDGREETFIKNVTNDISDDLAIYSLAKNAKKLGQTDAIDFKLDSSKKDELYVINPNGKTTEEVSDILNKKGITFKTLGDGKIYVVNKEGEYFNSDMANVMELIESENNLDVSQYNGVATFVTGLSSIEDRPVAQKKYDDIITKYEDKSKDTIKESSISRKSDSKEGDKISEKTEIIKVPKSQVPVGEGETRVSRLESRMKGVMDKITPQEAEEMGIATYRKAKDVDQIKGAAEYVLNNPKEALAVVNGEIDAPAGLLNSAIELALREQATEANDVDLITKLASVRATRLGQEISFLRNADPNSPVTYIAELTRKKIEAIDETEVKVEKKREIKRGKEILKKSKPVKSDWMEFIEEIKC